MGHIILVGSYTGCSDLIHEVTVTGRRLPYSEVIALGLDDQQSRRKNQDSSYSTEWFEVTRGDTITIRTVDPEKEIDMIKVFEIPDTLPDPPQRTREWYDKPLEKYLELHCKRIR